MLLPSGLLDPLKEHPQSPGVQQLCAQEAACQSCLPCSNCVIRRCVWQMLSPACLIVSKDTDQVAGGRWVNVALVELEENVVHTW